MVFTVDYIAVGQIVLTMILPILVGLVTTHITSSSAKAWLLAGLSLISSVLAEGLRVWTEGQTFDVGLALVAAVPTFIGSVAIHYGLWKPTGVSEKLQEVGAAPKHAA